MEYRTGTGQAILPDIGWVIGPLMLVLLAFTVWCWSILIGFQNHQEGLTRHLSWGAQLRESQVALRLSGLEGAPEVSSAVTLGLKQVCQVVGNEEGETLPEVFAVIGSLEDYEASLIVGGPKVVETRADLYQHVSAVVSALESAAQDDVKQLEDRWFSIYILAGSAIVLALSNIAVMGYLWSQGQRLQSSAQALRREEARDSLTDLFNRNATIERGRELLRESRRNGQPLTLCLIELDGFSSVNEQYGYAVGDEALRTAAQRILGAVRGGDPVGRVGGDEFLVLLAGCKCLEAQRVSERIRRAFEDEAEMADVVIRTTVSVGAVVIYSDDTRSMETFMNVASQTLAWAKQDGRNRVRLQDLTQAERSIQAMAATPARQPLIQPELTIA